MELNFLEVCIQVSMLKLEKPYIEPLFDASMSDCEGSFEEKYLIRFVKI